ncbi:3-oxoacyl-ACP synthase [Arenibacter sp. GZD96]|uniref:hypothetical protein n=1 Tax=Aurantibrevibacter litoralis TaxID=3106030 RepID=UPI002AFE33B2|nr:hypothetical protein [Arenibacter sp. GZD-96]MEA1784464.1 3-oxoacyl-ACP synthase [Arenibacter sp. GZD-96]
MRATTKEQLYHFCLKFIEGRISRIQERIHDLRESLDSETKSSTGDKHETGRAMLQLELEKSGNQLAEAHLMKTALDRVEVKQTSKQVCVGSLVITTAANYFLAISAGECTVGALKICCISPNTPIGHLLLGKAVGETVCFRDAKIVIMEII